MLSIKKTDVCGKNTWKIGLRNMLGQLGFICVWCIYVGVFWLSISFLEWEADNKQNQQKTGRDM